MGGLSVCVAVSFPVLQASPTDCLDCAFCGGVLVLVAMDPFSTGDYNTQSVDHLKSPCMGGVLGHSLNDIVGIQN